MAQTASGAQQRGYFARHWRGELSLGKSFWLNGFLIGLISRAIFTILLTACQFLGSVPAIIAAFIVIEAFNILVVVWILVGIWRAATNHQGRKFWAVVAKIMVVIGAIGGVVIVAKNIAVVAEVIQYVR